MFQDMLTLSVAEPVMSQVMPGYSEGACEVMPRIQFALIKVFGVSYQLSEGYKVSLFSLGAQ